MKYTAEDFENAEFARHESGRARGSRLPEPDRDRQWYVQRPTNPLFMRHASDLEMAEDGWVPVREANPVTESELIKILDTYDEGEMGSVELINRLGVTTIPDPEPTNVELLGKLVRNFFAVNVEIGGEREDPTLAEFLHACGVKGPGIGEVES